MNSIEFKLTKTPAIPYSVVYRKRQKYIRIRLTGEGNIVVSAPENTPIQQIKLFVESKHSWIQSRYTERQNQLDQIDSTRSLLLEGVPHTIVFENRRASPVVLIKDNTIHIRKKDLHPAERPRFLKHFLRKQAKKLVPPKVSQLAMKTNITYERVTIRDQRTRWGSSSGHGTISLNWRIILLPPEVCDYLIIHELVHQTHRNHSPRYWQAVSRLCGEYKKHDKWLKDNSILMGLFRE